MKLLDKKQLSGYLAYFIFMMSFISMIGSLYYQYYGDPVVNLLGGYLFPFGQGFVPCLLCWYARILMYPIALISLVGIITGDMKFVKYVIPLTGMGIALEAYHYALQMLPIKNIFECTSANPCNALDVTYFGFVTIPFLALIAFLLLTIASVWLYRISASLSKEK